MNGSVGKRQFFSWWLPAAVIVLLALWVRLVSVSQWPLFIDEATDILWMHRIVGGELFAGLNDRGWLYFATLALFSPLGPEAPSLGRALSALVSTFTVASCIALGRWIAWKSWRSSTGLLAGLIYSLLPLAVFHEGQALVDPMLASFAAGSLVLTVRLVPQPRLANLVLLSLALAAALLTKLSALPYLAMPLSAAVLLARDRRSRWRLLAWSTSGVVLAIVLTAVPYWLAGRSVGSEFEGSFLAENTLLNSISNPTTIALVTQNIRDTVDALLGYVGPIGMMMAIVGGVWISNRRDRVRALAMVIPAFLFIAVPILLTPRTATGRLPPRYYLPNAVPLVVLAASGLQTIRQNAQVHRVLIRSLRLILLVGIVAPALWFDAQLILNPRAAPLTAVDRAGYLRDRDQVGAQLAARALLEAWRAAGGTHRIDVLAPGEEALLLGAYLGPRVGAFASHRPNSEDQGFEIASWLANGDHVFLLVPSAGGALPQTHEGIILEWEGSYGHHDLYEIAGGQGVLADRIYLQLTSDPAFMRDDYAALAAALTQDTTPRQVIVFPAVQAAGLMDHTGLSIIPFPENIWPATPRSVERALGALVDLPDSTPVDVVLVDEARTDLDASVALGLQHGLYQTGEESWFGLLHWQRFLTGPADPPLTQPGITYENTIELEAVSVLDSAVQPGDFVRLVLVWKSPVIVRDSFHVFTHIVDETGTLQSQYDSVPLNGLMPMTIWQPGELVGDRFAIRLPSDAPPGSYEIRVGLYEPTSGLRLTVSAGEEIGPGYAIIGRITVQP